MSPPLDLALPPRPLPSPVKVHLSPIVKVRRADTPEEGEVDEFSNEAGPSQPRARTPGKLSTKPIEPKWSNPFDKAAVATSKPSPSKSSSGGLPANPVPGIKPTSSFSPTKSKQGNARDDELPLSPIGRWRSPSRSQGRQNHRGKNRVEGEASGLPDIYASPEKNDRSLVMSPGFRDRRDEGSSGRTKRRADGPVGDRRARSRSRDAEWDRVYMSKGRLRETNSSNTFGRSDTREYRYDDYQGSYRDSSYIDQDDPRENDKYRPHQQDHNRHDDRRDKWNRDSYHPSSGGQRGRDRGGQGGQRGGREEGGNNGGGHNVNSRHYSNGRGGIDKRNSNHHRNEGSSYVDSEPDYRPSRKPNQKSPSPPRHPSRERTTRSPGRLIRSSIDRSVDEDGDLAPSASGRPSRESPVPAGSAPLSEAGLPRKRIKRHTQVSTPRSDTHPLPPPSDSRPATPPGPPPGLSPPPPPPQTPPPPPTPPPPEVSQNPYSQSFKPINKNLDPARPRDGQSNTSTNYHPVDRNHSNVPTRVNTPVQLPRTEKRFTMRTEKQEMEKLGRIFQGVTTLADYGMGDKLGEGTFGVVTKATEKVGGALVALKKLITHNIRDGVSVTTVREIKILKALSHQNVVPIRAMVVNRKTPNDSMERGDVFMVFPYMDHDLCGLLANPAFRVNISVMKTLLQQLLEGLVYIHSENIIHRDIKTANILVDRNGRVMIADFGLARPWTPKGIMPPHTENEYTNMVVTRWYRAPELLLGKTKYGPEIDLWSVGCVFGEMFHRNPILCGESDRDQLYRIISKCGPINAETFPGWAELPGFPDAAGHPWDTTPLSDKSLFELAYREWGMDKCASDLLESMLKLDPAKRVTAVDALDHKWFWIAPMPQEPKEGLITVESSHEFTTRRPEQVAPGPPAVPHGRNKHTARPPPLQQPYGSRQPGQGAFPPRPPGISNQSIRPGMQNPPGVGMGVGYGNGQPGGAGVMGYNQNHQNHRSHVPNVLYSQQQQSQQHQIPVNQYSSYQQQQQQQQPNHYTGTSNLNGNNPYGLVQTQDLHPVTGYPIGMPPTHSGTSLRPSKGMVPTAPFILAGNALPVRPPNAPQPPSGFTHGGGGVGGGIHISSMRPTGNGYGHQGGYSNGVGGGGGGGGGYEGMAGGGGLGNPWVSGGGKRPPSGPAGQDGNRNKRPRPSEAGEISLPYNN